MTKLVTAVLSVALLAGFSGTGFAQGGMMSSGGSMGGTMSKKDMATMKKCQGMSERAMMKNKNCMAMMKKHPEMMGSGNMGSSSGSMNSGSMNNNMKR